MNTGWLITFSSVSIMGWVTIWEATSITIMQRPELVAMKKNYEQLLKGKIIFHVEADQPIPYRRIL